jgi:hypothetical protein
LLLRPSKALDALRRAKLYGTLRDTVILLVGAGLVAASAVLPLVQEILLAGGGATVMITGVVFLVLRQIRGYRSGSES